jgi:hypothetical protein
MRLMLVGLETPEESAIGDEELLIHLSWYAEAWTVTAQRLLEAERAGPTVTTECPPGTTPLRRPKDRPA